LAAPQLDSAFQLQEHLAALHYHHTASGTTALTRSTALQLAQPPVGIDRTLWLYELGRFLVSQCNSLIVGFLFDTPPCSASTCPEMRASEWQFLCAVHEQPKSCCAIDYCCHTLDWAANVVTDQKLFPSRFAVANDAHSKTVGVKNLVNVFRRLHRIFAHAWFQHRSVFWAVEGQTGLYVFFKTVCDLYDLLPAENYKLPPEAEGLEAPPPPEPEAEKLMPSAILKPSSQIRNESADDDNIHGIGRTNTRRHIRSSPSTGSAVTTVIEAEEEEGDGMAQRMREMHISAPEVVEEEMEPEAEEVPVMVEQSVMAEAESPQQPTPTAAGMPKLESAAEPHTAKEEETSKAVPEDIKLESQPSQPVTEEKSSAAEDTDTPEDTTSSETADKVSSEATAEEAPPEKTEDSES
jgi:hypothetical protein